MAPTPLIKTSIWKYPLPIRNMEKGYKTCALVRVLLTKNARFRQKTLTLRYTLIVLCLQKYKLL